MIEPGPESIELTFDKAWLYCACLYHKNYSDWRLPNFLEITNVTNSNLLGLWYDHDDIDTNTWDDTDLYYTLPVRTKND